MKKIILSSITCGIFVLLSCNNEGKQDGAGKKVSDSLMEKIDDVHIKGMAKMGRLTKLEKATRETIDSINKLPAAARTAAATYKASLDSLLLDLTGANTRMDAWMNNFAATMDSGLNNEPVRIKYLEVQAKEVDVVVSDVLNSIRKADSVLKKKIE